MTDRNPSEITPLLPKSVTSEVEELFLLTSRRILELSETTHQLTSSLLEYTHNNAPGIHPDLVKMRKGCIHLLEHTTNLPYLKPSTEGSKNDFWAKVRHDIRGIAGSIGGYGELILEEISDYPEIPQDISKKIITDVEDLLKNIKSLVDSVEDLNWKGTYAPEEIYSTLLHEKNSSIKVSKLKATILIVDDTEANRDILKRRLERTGHTVYEATNGRHALDILKLNQNIDLILLDLIMPEINGYETLNILKGSSDYQHIPVLMISAIGEVESVVKCIESGAEDFLTTPFNPILLDARINASLEKKHMRDRERAFMDQLSETRHQLSAAIESFQDGFALFDSRDLLILSNTTFQEWYPSTIDGLGTLTYDHLIRRNFGNGIYLKDRRSKLTKVSEESWILKRLEYHQNPVGTFTERLADGTWIEISETKTADGSAVCVHKNITAQKLEEQRLNHIANHDGLTGLANRKLLLSTLEEMTDPVVTPQPFALIYLDLDGFKTINDTLGHDFGDYVLINVSLRLKQSVRESDLCVRLGGDEFCILLPDITKERLEPILNRIFKTVGTEIKRDNQTGYYGISAGVALYPEDAHSPEQLMLHADEAMYDAKHGGKGTYRYWSDIAKP